MDLRKRSPLQLAQDCILHPVLGATAASCIECTCPLAALHHLPDRLAHRHDHGRSCGGTGPCIGHVLIECGLEVSFVPCEQVCVAGLQEPSELGRHQAVPDACARARADHGAVQMDLRTIHGQYWLQATQMRRKQAAEDLDNPHHQLRCVPPFFWRARNTLRGSRGSSSACSRLLSTFSPQMIS